jgi:hypothetical protein
MTEPDPRRRSDAATAGIARLSGLEPAALDVVVEGAAPDRFRVWSDGTTLHVRATTPAVALAGYAQFVRRTGTGSVSRSGVRRPDAVPAAGTEVSGTAALPDRVAYNITVSGYTTPFFRWEEWEAELDLLAASGITAAHLTLGQEAVWLTAFARFGYTEEELLAWIVPPSHQPWQWLNNIQSFGGGTTRAIVEARVALARRVLARMAELEIAPILPGFSGTVPPGFAERNPGAVVVPQGRWYMDIAGPVRPDWLSTDGPVYQDVAAAFYDAQRELFARSGAWAVDLLHEGGKIGDATLADAARGVERAMHAADSAYTWYVQAWLGNPRQELLDALDTSRLYVLDLVGEHWATMDGYGDTRWAYGILPNYGGRTSLYGDLSAIAAAPATLFDPAQRTGRLSGLTDMAEGVANNPVVWDLFHDLAWTTAPIDLDAWLDEWVAARYGVAHEAARRAWRTLHGSAYGTWRTPAAGVFPRETALAVQGQPVDATTVDTVGLPEGSVFSEAAASADAGVEAVGNLTVYASTDSVIAAIPSLEANQASIMGPRALPYPADALVPALAALVEAAEATGSRTPSMEYDLVDVARQALADAARAVLPRVAAAYAARDVAAFDAGADAFLALVDEQDRLLATHPDFRLDTWTDAAATFGSTPAESAQLVEWGKRLLTAWAEQGDLILTEYATRDWAGLVGGYYRRRWTLWFEELRHALRGEPTTPVDWAAVADAWAAEPEVAIPPRGEVLAAARSALAAARAAHAAG